MSYYSGFYQPGGFYQQMMQHMQQRRAQPVFTQPQAQSQFRQPVIGLTHNRDGSLIPPPAAPGAPAPAAPTQPMNGRALWLQMEQKRMAANPMYAQAQRARYGAHPGFRPLVGA